MFFQLGSTMLAAGLCQVLELLAVGVLHLLLDHELDRFVHKVELGDRAFVGRLVFWSRDRGSSDRSPDSLKRIAADLVKQFWQFQVGGFFHFRFDLQKFLKFLLELGRDASGLDEANSWVELAASVFRVEAIRDQVMGF